jgi:hypothetical protein
MNLEERIAALEKKFGRHGQPRVTHRMVFVDAASHEVTSVLVPERGIDPRDGVLGKHWFHRLDGETEAEFLARVENSTQKQEA